ncbi:MAG: hypothetical protein IPK71_19380 [Myxococcales bacterium]|nr:hypothetical protein [Myxococcales bacterium]
MATYEETLEATVLLLRRHVPASRNVLAKHSIQGDLGLDSLAVMELVADAEDRFRVTIPNEILTELVTVDDVARAIHRLQGA